MNARDAFSLAIQSNTTSIDSFFRWVKEQASSGQFSGILSLDMLNDGQINYLRRLGYTITIYGNIIKVDWSQV